MKKKTGLLPEARFFFNVIGIMIHSEEGICLLLFLLRSKKY